MYYLVCGIWCIYGILYLHNTPERDFKPVSVVPVPSEDEKGISPDCDSERNALKEEFVQKYVRKDYKQSPIYEVFESLFDQEKSGTFAARAFKCALSAPNWLNNYPGYTDARRLFPHEDAIKGTKSNYSNANNEKNCSKEIMETINKLLEDKLKEMIDKSETQQN